MSTGISTEEQYLVEGGKLIFNPALKDVAIYVNYKRNEVVDVLDISSRDLQRDRKQSRKVQNAGIAAVRADAIPSYTINSGDAVVHVTLMLWT